MTRPKSKNGRSHRSSRHHRGGRFLDETTARRPSGPSASRASRRRGSAPLRGSRILSANGHGPVHTPNTCWETLNSARNMMTIQPNTGATNSPCGDERKLRLHPANAQLMTNLLKKQVNNQRVEARINSPSFDSESSYSASYTTTDTKAGKAFWQHHPLPSRIFHTLEQHF